MKLRRLNTTVEMGEDGNTLYEWLGYDASEDCWLQADELKNAPVVLADYLAS